MTQDVRIILWHYCLGGSLNRALVIRPQRLLLIALIGQDHKEQHYVSSPTSNCVEMFNQHDFSFPRQTQPHPHLAEIEMNFWKINKANNSVYKHNVVANYYVKNDDYNKYPRAKITFGMKPRKGHHKNEFRAKSFRMITARRWARKKYHKLSVHPQEWHFYPIICHSQKKGLSLLFRRRPSRSWQSCLLLNSTVTDSSHIRDQTNKHAHDKHPLLKKNHVKKRQKCSCFS